MGKIKAYVGYDERTNERRYFEFEITDKAPEVGFVVFGDEYDSIDVRDGFREVITEVHELKPLKEQDSDEAFNYDYYYVVVGCEIYLENFDDWKSEEHIYTMYYAVKRS